MIRWTLVGALVFSVLVGAMVASNSANTDTPTQVIGRPMNVLDHRGNIHSISPTSTDVARVFVFLTGECPIATAYVPTLQALSESIEKNHPNVSMYAVWADRTKNPAEVAKFAAEYQVELPILLDLDGSLASSLRPTHVPEAFVLDSKGNVAYRGRIDDVYNDLGRRKPEATVHDLADAVNTVAEGRAVATNRTAPVGCLFELPPAMKADDSQVTYNRDVAPILFANCMSCHREGEIAPFPLTSYEHAAKRAAQIARVVDRRLMPPWLPAQNHGEFVDQRVLTDEQIAVLKKWAETGREQGDPLDLPTAPTFASGWQLGEPDLIVEMPEEFEISADGPDIYQNFVIPVDIPEDKLVAGIQFVPGNPRVVHHCLLYLDGKGQARALDAKTPQVGYSTFGGPGFLPSGSIGGWSPGSTPRRMPEGHGRSLKKGSDLVMQIHYHPTGKIERDRSKVAIYFTDRPKRAVEAIWLSRHNHDIAPGDSEYRLEASLTLPCDITMFGVIPHMHLLGRTIVAKAVLPDGKQIDLVSISNWDFNWQDDYRFASPVRLPAGTRLEVAAMYDNSDGNPSNPSTPPRRVTWGEETNDEMLYCFFLISTDSRTEFRTLISQVLMSEVASRAKARAAMWSQSPSATTKE
jgi:hypothetical protein